MRRSQGERPIEILELCVVSSRADAVECLLRSVRRCELRLHASLGFEGQSDTLVGVLPVDQHSRTRTDPTGRTIQGTA
jgi:hypothetical protein